MTSLSQALTLFVALQHVVFLILEMFLWKKPLGLKVFRQTKEAAEATAVMAKNQGLYNGFLAAGLFWSFFVTDPSTALSIRVFFLLCVLIAGIYGAVTAHINILWVQALPAFVALGALLPLYLT